MYEGNPYRTRHTDDLCLVGAFLDDRLVGVHGWLPLVVNHHGTPRTGCHFCNWLAAPDMRRGSWPIRLTTDPIRAIGADACFGFAFTPQSRPILQRLGWTIDAALPRHTRILDAGAFAGLFAGQPAVVEATAGWASGPCPAEGGDVVERASLRDVDWDDVYWSQLAPASWGPARERAWLVWRYEEVPGFAYRFLTLMRDGAPAGLLVFRVELVSGTPFTVIRIVDILAGPEDWEPLLARCVAIGVAAGAALADFFCASTRVGAVLAKAGFVAGSAGQPDPVPFLFRPLDPTPQAQEFGWQFTGADPAVCGGDLYLTKADGDFDRPN